MRLFICDLEQSRRDCYLVNEKLQHLEETLLVSGDIEPILPERLYAFS